MSGTDAATRAAAETAAALVEDGMLVGLGSAALLRHVGRRWEGAFVEAGGRAVDPERAVAAPVLPEPVAEGERGAA